MNKIVICPYDNMIGRTTQAKMFCHTEVGYGQRQFKIRYVIYYSTNGNEQFIFQHIQKYNHTLAHCHSFANTIDITYIYAHIRVSPSKYIDKCISRIQTCIHTLCIQNTYTYIHICYIIKHSSVNI